jgi:hypothetical protein
MENWAEALKAYGFAAPFILFLLYVVKVLWDKIQRYEEKIPELLTQVISALDESNSLHRETVETLDKSNVQTHRLAGRPQMDPELWRRVMVQLDRLEHQ